MPETYAERTRADRIRQTENWLNAKHQPIPNVFPVVQPVTGYATGVEREVSHLKQLLRDITGKVQTQYATVEFANAVLSRLTPDEVARIDMGVPKPIEYTFPKQ